MNMTDKNGGSTMKTRDDSARVKRILWRLAERSAFWRGWAMRSGSPVAYIRKANRCDERYARVAWLADVHGIAWEHPLPIRAG